MTISTKQKLNLAVAAGFTLALALIAFLFLSRLSSKSESFASDTRENAAESLRAIRKVEEDLRLALAAQEANLAQQRKIEERISLLGSQVGELSAEFTQVATELGESSRQVKIVELKAEGLNEVISESVESLSYAFESLPEDDTRFELEDIYDELYDSQDLLQKEVILSLKNSSRSMDEFSEKINLTAGAVADLSKVANEQVALVEKASAKTEETAIRARDAIELTRATVGNQADILERSEATGIELEEASASTRTMLLAVSVVAISILVLVAFAISKSVISGLRQVMSKLRENKEATFVSTEEVGAISEALASGSIQLANVTEETSAAVQEVRAMSELNSDRAQDAQRKADEAFEATRDMSHRMTTLQSAIQEIYDSSEEIGGILANIEEVAFQTNLLALNAAVEAARAGEAGTGFAVVADEVRSLAIRSSEAAKKTAGVISRTQQLTNEGTDHCKKATTGLDEVLNRMREMHEGCSSISTASAEQVEGLTQLSVAIEQVEELSRSLKSKSSDASAASQNLRIQLDGLDGQIEILDGMVEKNPSEATPRVVRKAVATEPVAPLARSEVKEELFTEWEPVVITPDSRN